MRELLAHVAFRGPIRERTVEPYLRLLQRLRVRRRVKGVLFDISSGGGEVVASKDLYLAVRRLDQTTPVVASIGGIGASGAYFAALGARRLYAYPESLVGSIGVVYPHVAARDLVRRLGLSIDLIHAGEHKDAFQGYRPLTEVERTKLQGLAQDDYERFVAVVAQARHKPLEEVRTLATGEFWSGARAAELGLVDVLGDREEALGELARLTGVSPRKSVRVEPPRSLFERVLSGGSSAVAGAMSRGAREFLEDTAVDGFPLLSR